MKSSAVAVIFGSCARAAGGEEGEREERESTEEQSPPHEVDRLIPPGLPGVEGKRKWR